jgi:hypothetical protein
MRFGVQERRIVAVLIANADRATRREIEAVDVDDENLDVIADENGFPRPSREYEHAAPPCELHGDMMSAMKARD